MNALYRNYDFLGVTVPWNWLASSVVLPRCEMYPSFKPRKSRFCIRNPCITSFNVIGYHRNACIKWARFYYRILDCNQVYRTVRYLLHTLIGVKIFYGGNARNFVHALRWYPITLNDVIHGFLIQNLDFRGLNEGYISQRGKTIVNTSRFVLEFVVSFVLSWRNSLFAIRVFIPKARVKRLRDSLCAYALTPLSMNECSV
jgi:hypothetical protein